MTATVLAFPSRLFSPIDLSAITRAAEARGYRIDMDEGEEGPFLSLMSGRSEWAVCCIDKTPLGTFRALDHQGLPLLRSATLTELLQLLDNY